MSALSELMGIVESLGIPVETGAFSEKLPRIYVALTPLSDTYGLFADNEPLLDVPQVRLSLFCQGNYLSTAKGLTTALLEAGFTVTDRRYIGREDDTGYHHYSVDAEKEYSIKEED